MPRAGDAVGKSIDAIGESTQRHERAFEQNKPSG
jgi:hypothetical protein